MVHGAKWIRGIRDPGTAFGDFLTPAEALTHFLVKSFV